MPMKILVVDDSATMRRVLEMTFAGEDAHVTTVRSGEEALAKARELGPDVVFADASMQGMDGYDVARAIKEDATLARTAVIVMASQSAPFDEARGKASGVDAHIAKPFDTQAVIDRTHQTIAKPRSTVAAAPAAAAPRPVAPPPAAPAARSAAAAPAPAPAARPIAAPAPVAPPRAAQPTPAAARPAAPVAAPARAPAPVAPAPARPAAVAQRASQASADLAPKLAGLGLSPEQVDGVLALSRDVIERVVWEVVPDLAETIIREEIQRLTAE